MDKETSKQQIAKLVEKYNRIKEEDKINFYKEAQTRNEFIEPFFEFLGWDMRNIEHDNEITPEESISKGRVDLAFRINGIAKFFLEAKPLKANLDDERYARQAISYSWNRGVNWAILTDFESIKVYNALTQSKNLLDKLVFEIPCDEYLSDFDRLWLLSKEAFENNELDKYAEKYGKKLKKLTVNEKLYNDLKDARQILTRSFGRWNEEVDQETLDEGVQRILDRLVFIRVLEDRGLKDNILRQVLNEWKGKKDKQLFDLMKKKFIELDYIYDSNIFKKHACDNWVEYDDEIKKVIDCLYGNNIYEYDFKSIPADILGGVYESYLGYISQNPIKVDKEGKSGKLLDIEDKEDIKIKSRKKRKEQGIYYTPKFIVDYIIGNTLGAKLKEINSMHALKQIKVLDPACGSGSFLNKALEAINNKYKEFGNAGDQYTKAEILLGNIYGVDLDPQAIELAKLNLLIETLDKKAKLPDLTNNIRVGNSLISGAEEELKKYFGENWRDKKPFNWQEKFNEVFKQGGFDVIIGNPPYIKEFINKSAFDGLHNSPYYQGKMDIWTMFACVAIDLLKEGGVLSFIAPNNWITNFGASIFREKILKEGQLISFVDFGDYKVFEQAGIQTMIFVFQKKKPSEKYKVDYLKIEDKNIAEDKLISKLYGEKTKIIFTPKGLIGKNITFENSRVSLILDKIQKKRNFELLDDEISNGIHHHHDCVNKERKDILGNNFSIGDGIFVLNESEKKQMQFNKNELEIIKPSYTTEQINRYYADPKNKEWVIYTDSSFKGSDKINNYPNIKKHLDKFKKVITSDNKPYGLHRAKKEKFFIGEKIIVLRKCLRPSFAYVNFDSYVSATFYIIKSERINQKYLTAILNSKIIAFWLKNKGKMQGNNYQLDKDPLMGIPIYECGQKQQKPIIDLVDKILKLNKEIKNIIENSDKYHQIKKEIEKIDKEIDQRVYELYGLTEEEIKMVEVNL